MSLVDGEDRHVLLVMGPPGDCFLCGRPVELSAIVWHGTEIVWLHLRCALHLSRALLQDVEKVMDLAALRREWAA